MNLEQKKIETILKACDDKKAYNFVVLDISKISSVTDYFVICSGNNERQTVAIAEAIEEYAEKEGYTIYHKEGYSTGRWVLLELDNVIVHVFHKDERDLYDLETLWNEGENLDVEQFGIKNWK